MSTNERDFALIDLEADYAIALSDIDDSKELTDDERRRRKEAIKSKYDRRVASIYAKFPQTS